MKQSEGLLYRTFVGAAHLFSDNSQLYDGTILLKQWHQVILSHILGDLPHK